MNATKARTTQTVRDWRTRVEAWMAGEPHTDDDLKASLPWSTCATSECDARIPCNFRNIADCPKDYELRKLGSKFHDAVSCDRDFGRALEILNAINHREIELLMQMGAAPQEGRAVNEAIPREAA